MKPLEFAGRSREDLQEFPRLVRRAVGLELLKVQMGELPRDFKPMPSVGKGVYEIRVRLERGMAFDVCGKVPGCRLGSARVSEEDSADISGRY